jgi:hypothetical protein
VNRIRRGSAMLLALVGILLIGVAAEAQVSVVDTVVLKLVPPDSFYVKRDGRNLVVRWYPPDGGLGQATGSRNFSLWYLNRNPAISRVNVIGQYSGTFDRTLLVHKNAALIGIDTIGTTKSIAMLAELTDRLGAKESYAKEFNLGTRYATMVGDSITVPMVLVGLAKGDTLRTGVSIVFKRGIIDNSTAPASFTIDLQTYEGFHIWRGLSPLPSHMEIVDEISRDNAAMGIPVDSIYFQSWPKKDAHGRDYYEWVDDGVYPGFTYFYNVTIFDKGYFLGKYQHNKADNFICDEDTSHPATPGHPVPCEDVAERITMTVSTQDVMRNIFAVPNPYRTGTSAETTPFYHNFPDMSIKFYNVPDEATVRIFTLAGDLVFETHHSSPDGSDGIVSWDARNKHGQDVASGVYIYRVTSPAGHMYGRICVIR